MKKKYTIASFFSGIGGLDLGFQKAGGNIIWACDNSETAVKSYNLNFSHESMLADVNKLTLKDIPNADIFIGGPPCQSFSLVGKRLNEDPRGELIFKFKEIIKSKAPKAFVIENVPGLSASLINGERVTALLKKEFEEMGYQVTLSLLDATDYLVPQKRKRLIMVGAFNRPVGKPDKELFALKEYNVKSSDFDISSKAAIGDLGRCTGPGKVSKYQGNASKFAALMKKENQDGVTLHEMPRMSDTDKILINHIPPGGNYEDVPDEFSTGRIMNFKKTGGRTTTYGRLHPKKPAYTINTYFRRPNVGCNIHYSQNRLITPREAMRFQSIPDYFQLWYKSKESRNTLIGNAVPPLMAHAIAWNLIQTLNQ